MRRTRRVRGGEEYNERTRRGQGGQGYDKEEVRQR